MLPIPSLLGAKLLEEVKRRIARAADNYFVLNEVRLTTNEFIQAFIRTEHVPVLMRTNELCGGVSAASAIHTTLCPENDPDVRVAVRFLGKHPLPVPTYISEGLSPDCPSPLRDRIMSWITDRIRSGDILGDLHDAITIFDRTLNDLRSFAIMVPCLPMIVKSLNEPHFDKILKKMNKGTNFKLPHLPPEVAERIHNGNAFYIGLSMITAKAPHRSSDEIWLERSNYQEMRTRPHVFKGTGMHDRLSSRGGASL